MICPRFTTLYGMELSGEVINYEWGSFRLRSGLVKVDFTAFTHTEAECYIFRDMIRQSGFTQNILKKYLHELPTLEPEKNI